MRSLRRSLVALLTLLLATLYLPLTQASEPRTEISKGHTDSFYVVTDSGTPVVKVANGIRNDLYDPNSVFFLIDNSTYGTDYNFKNLSRSSAEGYYTASFNANGYFEPGWSAPGFADNGFESIRIEFTSVTGPSPVALFGNDPLSEDDEYAILPVLADGKYYIEPGTSLPILGHTHAHWYFERAGTYTLTGHAVGVTQDGQELRSEPFTEIFKVEKNAQDARQDLPSSSPSEDPVPSPPTPHPTESSSPSDPPNTMDDSAQPQPHTLVTEPRVISNGHIDLFNVTARGSMLELAVKDDTGSGISYRTPESVKVKIDKSALTELPASRAQQLASKGYFISENGTSQRTLPFMGWDTSAVAPEYSAIDFKFLEVTGPGRILLFQTSLFSGLTSPFTHGGYEMMSGSVIHQNLPSHVHTNWLFTEPGVYTVKVRAQGTPVGGGPAITSNTGIYTFEVGSEVTSATASEDPEGTSMEVPLPGTSSPSVIKPAPAQPTESAGVKVAPPAVVSSTVPVADPQPTSKTQGEENAGVRGATADSSASSAHAFISSKAPSHSTLLAHTGPNGVMLILIIGLLLSLAGFLLVRYRRLR
ncbi:choice-of-anchor M domain-containing protein [Rothia sp. ZJ1223]|uniref:choice-of-anchor M domain-containing protein n=1 Tax=Rothia sp. ZJ1223 TaxID=2811098 RepID=UPI00195AAE7B|nr:choice-of-anchor M domain-containing protein [Rothia sp. ZJ1223]MBM7052019.1 choice-of-anchor M domain-containing protein [Rothia sp. ZJ1223]